jgi:hypothetical protein
MPRVPCPDCRAKVPDLASSCPRCGHPAPYGPPGGSHPPDSRGSPWRCDGARHIDIILAVVLVGVPVAVWDPRSLLSGGASRLGLAFLPMLLWPWAEAAFLTMWGKRPGKAVLGVGRLRPCMLPAMPAVTARS